MNDNAFMSDFNRRDFIKGTSVATLMAMMGAVRVNAQDAAAAADKPAAFHLKVGVIGLGARGREIISTLATFKESELVAICDKYPAFLRRAGNVAPKAKQYEDYKQLLADANVQAVIIATPSHQHKEVTLAALKAGKHVFCEAPLAHTVEDAREIALAAKNAYKQLFQGGLQMRSDPQRDFLLPFIRAGATGKPLYARAQWHKKTSWRAVSPNADRERELNWRLSSSTSPGLVGEIGIHQIDQATLFLNSSPMAATGFGSILAWRDGRDVADTIQAVIEYPGGVNMVYTATLGNSFDSDYEMIYGTEAGVMLRENKAWMFKEVDSPLLGWEVYARKDNFYKETGIALVANATKLLAQGDKPVEDAPFTNTPLFYALEAFLYNVNETAAGVEDFEATFDKNDRAGLEKHLATLTRLPAADWKAGYDATVIALKVNEAIRASKRVEIQKELFDLA